MTEADVVEGPVEGVTYGEVMQAMNKIKLGKAAGPSEVNMDVIMVSGKFGALSENTGWSRIGQRNGKRVLLLQSLKERGV